MRTTQVLAIDTESGGFRRLRRFAGAIPYSAIALFLVQIGPLRAQSQEVNEHAQSAQHQEPSWERQRQAGELLRIVRESTERFRDVSVAEAEGYALQFGCVTGPDKGAMGLHY